MTFLLGFLLGFEEVDGGGVAVADILMVLNLEYEPILGLPNLGVTLEIGFTRAISAAMVGLWRMLQRFVLEVEDQGLRSHEGQEVRKL